MKDFKPFSDLWLTIDKWYDRHEHWMTDEWEMLDGREIEDTVENSVKTISGVYRIFNSKEDKSMMPVVSKIKEDVDYFR